jgi:hypothetical protein
MNEKLSVKIEDFKPMRSNTLRGFCTVVIPEVRLRVFDLTVHESHGRRWIGLPGRPQIDREGRVRRGDNGKPAYVPTLQFTDKAVSDAFSARAIEALLENFPDAFADADGAQ